VYSLVYLLLLLSIVGLESWFRDKYIVYLSMLCTLFFLILDVTFTVNELVGSTYSHFQNTVQKALVCLTSLNPDVVGVNMGGDGWSLFLPF